MVFTWKSNTQARSWMILWSIQERWFLLVKFRETMVRCKLATCVCCHTHTHQSHHTCGNSAKIHQVILLLINCSLEKSISIKKKKKSFNRTVSQLQQNKHIAYFRNSLHVISWGGLLILLNSGLNIQAISSGSDATVPSSPICPDPFPLQKQKGLFVEGLSVWYLWRLSLPSKK